MGALIKHILTGHITFPEKTDYFSRTDPFYTELDMNRTAREVMQRQIQRELNQISDVRYYGTRSANVIEGPKLGETGLNEASSRVVEREASEPIPEVAKTKSLSYRINRFRENLKKVNFENLWPM